jgi:hypothetical protein
MKTRPEDQRSDWGARRTLLGWMAAGILLGGIIGILIDDIETMVILGLLAGFAIGSRGGRSMGLMEYPPGVLRQIVLSGILFFAAFAGALYLLEQELSQPILVAIALLPTLPALFFAISIGSAISQLDEFQRRIQLEAISIGFALSLIAALGYGLVGLADVQQVSWSFVPAVMVFGWFIGKIWTMWKYR